MKRSPGRNREDNTTCFWTPESESESQVTMELISIGLSSYSSSLND